jgi:hypothetical protein
MLSVLFGGLSFSYIVGVGFIEHFHIGHFVVHSCWSLVRFPFGFSDVAGGRGV